MEEYKVWWKSKTVLLGLVVMAGGIAEYILGLPPEASIPTIIAGVMGIIIRFLTNEPLGK